MNPNPLKHTLALQESIHDEFVKALVEAVEELKLGHGIDPATTHGPMIQPGAVDKARIRR